MALADVMAGIAPEKKRSKSENPKKYVQFTGEEWKELEKGNGGPLEPSHVKARLQGIFAGKVNVTKKG